jgi:hypothetical protein
MNLEKYAIESDERHLTYEFFSKGPKGVIKKGILYEEIKKNVFNLGFGDWNDHDKTIDDNVRSNNNDRDKVLATVAATVIDFVRHHPTALIVAKGATSSRTRLYQMSILANWQQISELFNIEGFRNGKWEVFKKGRNYEAFSIQAK